MRKIRIGFGLACALTLCAATARAADAGSQGVDAAWVKAMLANDLEAVAACYAPDAVLWLPNMPEARGSKAIHDAYAGLLGAMTVENVSLANTSYQTTGDLSTGWGTGTLTLRPKKGGDLVVMHVRFVDVARRVDGRWLYAADHASDEPAPTPAKP